MQIDFTPNSNDVSTPISDLIDAFMEAERDEQTPRAYLGGSRLGDACDRKLAFEFQHYESENPFSGQTLRRFNRGHDCEIRMADYLRGAGFELLTEKAEGKQFGFYVANDENGVARIAGHLDGIIMAGPLDPRLGHMKYPALWENKALNNAGVNKLRRNGLKREYPVYYAQMQIYMAYMDLTANAGLFTAFNSDDCTLYCELIPFDVRAAQEASDRGARVVSAGTPYDLPRCTRDPADFRCTFCGYKAKCWDDIPHAAPQAIQAAVAASPIVVAPPQPTAPAWVTGGK